MNVNYFLIKEVFYLYFFVYRKVLVVNLFKNFYLKFIILVLQYLK